jgi:tetratricopeptide (TPR) repeat protein
MRESSSSGSDDDPRAAGQAQQPGPPDGASEESAYDWYTRGLRLLEARSAAAAEQLLTRAAAAEPESRSILEALGRAQFEAGRYNSARESFAKIIEVNPADDYAHFALGLSAARTGDLRTAVEHLALAAAMRPELPHYGRELRMARARQEGAL